MNRLLYLHLHKPPVLEVKYFEHFTPTEISQINAAMFYAYTSHFGQMRQNGTPYIDHPIRMMKIAMDRLGIYDTNLIITLILHDVDEESHFLLSNVVIGVWFGLKQKHNITMLTKTKENKETYLLDIMLCEIWEIILSKLIDRTDNMETLDGLDAKFQQKQLDETVRYFFGLCNTLSDIIPKEFADIPDKISRNLLLLCEKYVTNDTDENTRKTLLLLHKQQQI